ncbi:hypothetical protein SAY86_028263 [Trapa natans]|uniref:glucan endo-1,3-beta-D-glucosidase n=1 Tax=Trapa natans TaxID=22666 RepID=A0AAN7MCK9_TRANT|nr:hypothetical protein SAY86_028263 [Trapa natans]
MELPSSHSTPIRVILLMISVFSMLNPPAEAALGINYGQLGNDLPPPDQAVKLIKSIGATRVKIFDANPAIIQALANTDIELGVMVKNDEMGPLGNLDAALAWVNKNVVPFLPATNITTIAIGNEILAQNDPALAGNLFPAMQNVYAALTQLGLQKQIFVTTPHAYNIMGASYPPSAGAFRQDMLEIIKHILDFCVLTGAPFWVNVYPFFVYKDNSKDVDINYATFRTPVAGVDDPATKLHYDNLLFAQVDAVHAAIASLGYPQIPVHVTETGWPSAGDPTDIGVSYDNAASFNGNLKKLVAAGKTTPFGPNSELVAYIFALFNENMKTGPTIEKNFGLFYPNGTAVYTIN